MAQEFSHLPSDTSLSDLAEILCTPKLLPDISYHRTSYKKLLTAKGIDVDAILAKSQRNMNQVNRLRTKLSKNLSVPKIDWSSTRADRRCLLQAWAYGTTAHR